MRDLKKVLKTVVKLMRTGRPRRVTRRAVRKVWMDGTGLVQHAFAHPLDGRADCLRFAAPAEATGRIGKDHRIQHGSPMGRPDCLRFASPAEVT